VICSAVGSDGRIEGRNRGDGSEKAESGKVICWGVVFAGDFCEGGKGEMFDG
jgi:hypothetical protein